MRAQLSFPGVGMITAPLELARELREAGRRALNEAAEAGSARVVASMRARFDRPTPYALKALRTELAVPGGQLKAAVMVKGPQDAVSGGVPAQSFLRAEILGGARRWKRSEIALMRKNLIPRGWYTTPGRGAKLDAYGNVTRGQILHLLAYFEAFGSERGKRSNTTDKGRAKLAKGTKRRVGVRYFVQQPGAKGLAPGIWAMSGKPHAGFVGPAQGLRLVIAYVSAAQYRVRLPFYQILGTGAGQDGPPAMARQLTRVNQRGA